MSCIAAIEDDPSVHHEARASSEFRKKVYVPAGNSPVDGPSSGRKIVFERRTGPRPRVLGKLIWRSTCRVRLLAFGIRHPERLSDHWKYCPTRPGSTALRRVPPERGLAGAATDASQRRDSRSVERGMGW